MKKLLFKIFLNLFFGKNIFSLEDSRLRKVKYLLFIKTIEINDQSIFDNIFSIEINAWLIINLNKNK